MAALAPARAGPYLFRAVASRYDQYEIALFSPERYNKKMAYAYAG